jgi:F1F0 ATPase subunit 2
LILFTSLLGAFITGTVLGCMFFYVLWLSAQKVLASSHPVLWFVGAWLFRMPLALYGFYWTANDNWRLLLACLFGFIVGRWLIRKRLVDTTVNQQTNLDQTAKDSVAVEDRVGVEDAP